MPGLPQVKEMKTSLLLSKQTDNRHTYACENMTSCADAVDDIEIRII